MLLTVSAVVCAYLEKKNYTMKISFNKITKLLLVTAIGSSSFLLMKSEDKKPIIENKPGGCYAGPTQEIFPYFDKGEEIADEIRRIFHDSRKIFYFGTAHDGLAFYDGYSLKYLNEKNGLSGNFITQIIEDSKHAIWVSTQNGVSKIEDEKITNFGKNEGLTHTVWDIYEDKKGHFWAAAENGLFKLKGNKFQKVNLPEVDLPKRQLIVNEDAVLSITEDEKGNLYFGRDGSGVTIFDGTNFSSLTEKDGLCDNTISDIIQDQNNRMWFASMFNGLTVMENGAMKMYNQDNSEIQGVEVWSIYQDSKGNIWFPTEGHGIYKYDGNQFVNYGYEEGIKSKVIQTIYEDHFHSIWVGGVNGLYRLSGDKFIEVTSEGPWFDC